MNLTKLKNYAPLARQTFVQAMMDRAAFYGVTDAKIEPVVENGDIAFIGGQEHPRAVVPKRKALEDLVARDGFAPTMEKLAYTWFNRLVAIRYMELHGYLDHGYRVLSHPEGKPTPEILEHAEHVELPGLDKQTIIDLKLDGSKDAQLYRLLLVAQCNALNEALPFLFARINDEAELVLPDNLLHSESLTRKLVSEITQEDCGSVEILGWLYQFYISERKEEVMARKSAVSREDIPAVTQLFTPHWIVRYLVENSLGRLWLLNRPSSKLREHMPYYMEGEAETDFLMVSKPEDIRLLDPAVGSGHMLTYAFDLLCLIYEEEGYVPSEIPALILRHNLHGLEICPRAAQLAELTLVFKAREKSRRFFQPGKIVQPRILALQDIRFEKGELEGYFKALNINPATIVSQAAPSLALVPQSEKIITSQPLSFLTLLHQFEEATTFGSLIQPCFDEQHIAFVRSAIEAKDLGGQLFLHETHSKVLLILEQAEMLCQRYHVAVANPPYMGGKQMNQQVKGFARVNFPNSSTDLFAMFIERIFALTLASGYSAVVTMQSWMFLSSFELLRASILTQRTILSMIHMGNMVMGIAFGTAATVWKNRHNNTYRGRFCYLDSDDIQENRPSQFPPPNERNMNAANSNLLFCVSSDDLKILPGTPIAYWISGKVRETFLQGRPFSDEVTAKQGLATGDNSRFLRVWAEISVKDITFDCISLEDSQRRAVRWVPYSKGGEFRKWFGCNEFVIYWKNGGAEIRDFTDENGKERSRFRAADYYFRSAMTWGLITSGQFSARFREAGYVFDIASMSAFSSNDYYFRGLLNSKYSEVVLNLINPTLNYQIGDIKRIPLPKTTIAEVTEGVSSAVSLSRSDWNNFETSWDFHDLPLLRPGTHGSTLAVSWETWRCKSAAAIHRMQELETENNKLFINAYGLTGELKPEVSEEQITLARANARRDMGAFVSYAVGCMMGRYSLDHSGLILANAGDSRAEYLAKVGKPLDALTFTPDEDGIIPVLDGEWFEDDIVARTRDFLRATFGEATLQENLLFLEESLGKDLRKYFLTDFYKDHLQTYKRRPIYWLFSSGKQRAFQCLVYLHRYNEASLSRMRTEYVIPLQSRITARIELLKDDVSKATSTSHRKKLQKEQDDLKKQQTELLAFDEKLKHAADQKIKLDLDDGVKVNYGKFGDLLAEVKAVTGGTDE